jgi:hypothetical protein
MADPDNLILMQLRDLRAEIARQNELLVATAKKQTDMSRALVGETLLARYAVAEVEERLQAIEIRLDRLESSRS